MPYPAIHLVQDLPSNDARTTLSQEHSWVCLSCASYCSLLCQLIHVHLHPPTSPAFACIASACSVTVTSRIGDSAPLGVSAFVREGQQCTLSLAVQHIQPPTPLRNGAIIRDSDYDSDSSEVSPCIVAMAMASSPTT